ncbi:hypothetical protein NEISICOT_01163 [Neisseria sicca ATCC 29256]|uniref:Uncharacterized protein n=1 Tax=Neisseria sicca ATCC 29256 TaxID=547045 RepID=C6M3L5_NEISI|nr:hypothetical protein NEISICOT_01163 [Neisseria sicca ATCC 29256]
MLILKAKLRIIGAFFKQTVRLISLKHYFPRYRYVLKIVSK